MYVELAKKDLVKVYDFDSSSFHLLSALSLPLPSCPPPTLQCMYVDLYLLHTTFPPTCPTPSLLPAPPLPSYLPHPFPLTCPPLQLCRDCGGEDIAPLESTPEPGEYKGRGRNGAEGELIQAHASSTLAEKNRDCA